MRPIGVAILGLGTVGSGVYQLLQRNARWIEGRIGAPLLVRKVLDRNEHKLEALKVPKELRAANEEEILRHPEIDIVVELFGGVGEAKESILDAIAAGKHVVTANKALLAEAGPELLDAALKQHVHLAFEASVAGGIPILGALRDGLSANRIEKLLGIINGTCNYILGEMETSGQDFETILKEAQQKGYAEKDPALDVDGLDTAHKLAILLALAYGGQLSYKEIYTEGIRAIKPLDLNFAKKLGYRVKLLAIAKQVGSRIDARVHPTLVPVGSMIGKVEGVFNALSIFGDTVGETFFYGQGAGQNPTASSVVGDLIEIARQIERQPGEYLPTTGYPHSLRHKLHPLPLDEVLSEYYFRFSVIDRPSVLAQITKVLGDHHISIVSMYQEELQRDAKVPVVMMTHEAVEKEVRLALNKIDSLDVVVDKTVALRVERL